MPKIFLLTRPNHEYRVNYLYNWSDEIVKFADKSGIRKKVFSGKEVVRRNIENFVLSEHPRLAIFNGHGSETQIFGHNDLPVVDLENIQNLKDSIVYTIACHASKILGLKAVENGIEAFIGYSNEFAFVRDPDREASPLKDKRAEPFRKFSNSICISLLEGKSAIESCDKARALGNKLIEEYSTSDSEEVNKAIRFILFWDIESLKLDGNPNAAFV